MDQMTRQYLETALWSSNDNSNESGGEPFDKNYSIDDISPESIGQAYLDCKKFKELAVGLLDEARDDSQIGHDFWLTRNGHGAGFWDGDYPINGDKLTEIAKSFGELNPMLGDDEHIHFE